MTFEEWAVNEGEERIEWVAGEAIPKVSISVEHSRVNGFLLSLLAEFAVVHGLGEVHADPFGMRAVRGGSGRDPDIQFIRKERLHLIRGTYLDGPADLVVEVISPDGERIDRSEKFAEYEAGGVPEYWLVNPHKQTFEAFLLEDGRYRLAFEGHDGVYEPREMSGLKLNVRGLWERPALSSILHESGIL